MTIFKGLEGLYRIGLAILHHLENDLLKMNFIDIVNSLTHLKIVR